MRLVLVLALLVGCRRGTDRVRYAGPPVGACPAGRGYLPPAASEPTQEFIPVAEATPAPKAEESVAEPDDADEPKPKKKTKKVKP